MTNSIIVPEDFIAAHMAICHRKRKKVLLPPDKPHRNKGRYRHRTENVRKRECARKLYKDCIKLGIPPTPDREAFIKQYNSMKGIS